MGQNSANTISTKIKSYFTLDDYSESYTPPTTGGVLSHYRPIEESLLQREFHLPGHNYAGPGTRVISKVLAGVKPTSQLDAAALVHDVEYLSGNYVRADSNMEYNLGKNLHPATVATTLSFLAKDLVGYKPETDIKAYDYLKNEVVNKGLLTEYPNITFDPGLIPKG